MVSEFHCTKCCFNQYSILFVQEVIKLTKDLMELAPQVCCDMGSSHTIVVFNNKIIIMLYS